MRTELTAKQQAAVILVADDEKGDREIAEEVGVHVATLERWKQQPEFQAAVRAHIAKLAEELSHYHIARKDKRLAFMDRRWRAIQTTMDERAGDSLLKAQPGGKTGIIDKQVIPGARVHNYVVDGTLLDAALKLEKQAAQEMGQWSDKTENTLTVDVTHFFQEIENRWGESNPAHPPLLPNNSSTLSLTTDKSSG